MGYKDECASPDQDVEIDRVVRWGNSFLNMLDRPVTWFRKNIVESNRKEYPWYHMKLRRVPTVDQCFTDDIACIYEADQQYKRDKMVDSQIINILRYRMDDCLREEYPDYEKRCMPMKETYEQAAENWFIKYGDLGAQHCVVNAYMKQKHRMIWERRHGKVGTGMKRDEFNVEPEYVDRRGEPRKNFYYGEKQSD